MTVLSCVSCQERLSCADSALSITGNVIGILTFVGAAIISIQVYLNLMRNATREIDIMLRRLELRIVELQHLQSLLEIEKDSSGTLKEMLAHGLRRARQILADSEHLFLKVSRGTEGTTIRFLTRRMFAYVAGDLKKCIEEANEALDMVRGTLTAALVQ